MRLVELALPSREANDLKSEEYVVKVINWDGTRLVNICDKDLLGSTVKDDHMEMHISKDYFGGEVMDTKEALELVKDSSMSNLVGKKIVSEILRAKMASEEAVRTVGSVSFLMIFKFT